MNQSEPWSMAILAEIYMLRLEAAARAAKDTTRFIPITLPVVKAPLPSIRESSSAKPGQVSMGSGPLIELAHSSYPGRPCLIPALAQELENGQAPLIAANDFPVDQTGPHLQIVQGLDHEGASGRTNHCPVW
jgi:hypothetical protein